MLGSISFISEYIMRVTGSMMTGVNRMRVISVSMFRFSVV